MYTVLHQSWTFFHKLEFDMIMFVTYTFKVTIVGLALPHKNLRTTTANTVLATSSQKHSTSY